MFNALTEWLIAYQASWGLVALAAAAFLAATVLPLASEAALLAWLVIAPEQAWQGVAVASLANTAGGMTTFWLGRQTLRLGSRWRSKVEAAQAHYGHWIGRFGAAATGLGWVPVVGDALLLAAGALRINAAASAAWQLLGRSARYIVIAKLYL
jgi:membrane protein YqaA with SNARE-associated domain